MLDNFVGSGTTLVESNILGRFSVGVDLNPLACMITKAKITPISNSILQRECDTLVEKVGRDILTIKGQKSLDNREHDSGVLMARLPSEELQRWYFAEDLRQLQVIRYHIDLLQDLSVRNFANVCFSEILRKSSKADSTYPNLMIDKNARVKGRVFEYFRRQITSSCEKTSEFSRMHNPDYVPEVICADARNIGFVPDDRIHLIVSHPPYVAAVPYAEFMKLSLLWFGINPSRLESHLMAGKRRRRDVADRFIDDMQKVFVEMFRVLEPGRQCCVVIGNPESHGKVIELNKMLTEQGKAVGFKFEFEIPRARINMRKGKLRNEYILVFSK